MDNAERDALIASLNIEYVAGYKPQPDYKYARGGMLAWGVFGFGVPCPELE